MTKVVAMSHCGCRPYNAYSNDGHRLTLTYLKAMSDLNPNAFIWGKTLKGTVEAKIIILTRYFKQRCTGTMTKGQG